MCQHGIKEWRQEFPLWLVWPRFSSNLTSVLLSLCLHESVVCGFCPICCLSLVCACPTSLPIPGNRLSSAFLAQHRRHSMGKEQAIPGRALWQSFTRADATILAQFTQKNTQNYADVINCISMSLPTFVWFMVAFKLLASFSKRLPQHIHLLFCIRAWKNP